jgi:phage terminase large subunit-like protein
MFQHEARFEAGNILLPEEAPWLADLESEILSFPQGRNDDQVDALLLLLDWLAQNERWGSSASGTDYSWVPHWVDLMNT